mmetsp:Transcript_30859/g.75427  ORF Transcript_30859/g.75427 Transcript_30859/m.75427 type:complete len:220 (-) Transcript_30859:385-1044(-)
MREKGASRDGRLRVDPRRNVVAFVELDERAVDVQFGHEALHVLFVHRIVGLLGIKVRLLPHVFLRLAEGLEVCLGHPLFHVAHARLVVVADGLRRRCCRSRRARLRLVHVRTRRASTRLHGLLLPLSLPLSLLLLSGPGAGDRSHVAVGGGSRRRRRRACGCCGGRCVAQRLHSLVHVDRRVLQQLLHASPHGGVTHGVRDVVERLCTFVAVTRAADGY